jgi:hypothetical protein
LKQLRLNWCDVLDDIDLKLTLSKMPAGLEHLSLNGVRKRNKQGYTHFPTIALQQLQLLTYLELGFINLKGPGKASLTLQPLHVLTRLLDLRLCASSEGDSAHTLTASMLQGASQLTRLDLHGYSVEPGAVAGKVMLQHLSLRDCELSGGAAGVTQLLSHMQSLQQLTHLGLYNSLPGSQGGTPPAAAYSALTASSNLQHLDIGWCTLPAGAWQHLFTAGRQLPRLQTLLVTGTKQPGGLAALAPEGSRLVSCCPGLRHLDMMQVQYSQESLTPLQGLSRLQKLCLGDEESTVEGVEVVSRLLGLETLVLYTPGNTTERNMLLQLTALKHLTNLYYYGPYDGVADSIIYFDLQVRWEGT